MDRSRVAIVIPAYNEVDTIAQTVLQVMPYGTPIVVDDASNDNTAQEAKRVGAVVVQHKKNQGYDGALNSGFVAAAERKCKFVVTFDADGQHDASLISDYLFYLQKSADLVLGIRLKKPRFAEWLFGIVTKIRYGIQDPLCGMKGYRMHLYKDMGYFDSYDSIGTELLLYAVKRGYKVFQINVPNAKRMSRPRFGGTISANWRILRALVLGLWK